MKIRIEPMNENNETFIGKDIKEIQTKCFMIDFCKVGVGKKCGWYEYENYGLEANEGDLILFQMNNRIIASAKYVMKLPKPTLAFKVDINTIRIFKPITKEELHDIIPQFTHFGMVRWSFVEADVNMDLLEQRMSVPIDN